MLKTITVNKRMRLDELIKYAWENDIKNTIYESDNGQIVKFLGNGRYESGWNFGSDDLFTVRVEEEITEKTEFEAYAIVDEDCQVSQCNNLMSVGKIMEFIDEDSIKEIHAVINGKLELIWECEN